jgi:hypothetical protein
MGDEIDEAKKRGLRDDQMNDRMAFLLIECLCMIQSCMFSTCRYRTIFHVLFPLVLRLKHHLHLLSAPE